MEGENPTRRYKWFRPRQAARGYIDFTSTTHNYSVALYNDSTAAQYLVVRDWRQTPNGNSLVTGTSYFKGKLGTQAGFVTPLLPDGAKLPGILTQLDDPTSYTFDYSTGIEGAQVLPYWPHNFPFAVLPPNWSLVFSDVAGNGVIQLSILWEAIFPDELDFAFEL